MLSENMKNHLLKRLYEQYDEINSELQRDFVREHYEEDEIEDMKYQLEILDKMIKVLKED